jgi:hypothetical protein
VSVDLTAYAEADCGVNGWDLKGWWCGWIGERLFVLPLGDNGFHHYSKCMCRPRAEIVNGKPMIVHNAVDGREQFEGDQ